MDESAHVKALAKTDFDAPRLCSECRHWQHPDQEEWHGGHSLVGGCWGRCVLAETRGEPSGGLSLAYAIDCEEYWAKLMTRKDFGCVQFAAKE